MYIIFKYNMHKIFIKIKKTETFCYYPKIVIFSIFFNN